MIFHCRKILPGYFKDTISIQVYFSSVWGNFVIIKQKFGDVHKRFRQSVGRVFRSLRFDDKQKGQEFGVISRSVAEKGMVELSFGVTFLPFSTSWAVPVLAATL